MFIVGYIFLEKFDEIDVFIVLNIYLKIEKDFNLGLREFIEIFFEDIILECILGKYRGKLVKLEVF